MVATKTEHHAEARPKPPPGPKSANAKSNKQHPQPPPPNDGSAPDLDDMVRQGTVLRLMEHLNVGVQLAADFSKDPAFSADDRLQAVLATARMITANAHLGKAIGYLAQVEQRRVTVVQRLDPPKVWNDSNSIPEVLLEQELVLKMLRYMKVIADETFDPAIKEAAEKAAKDIAAQVKPAEAEPTEAEPAQPQTARANGASPSA
jgi:hypothetical protein